MGNSSGLQSELGHKKNPTSTIQASHKEALATLQASTSNIALQLHTQQQKLNTLNEYRQYMEKQKQMLRQLSSNKLSSVLCAINSGAATTAQGEPVADITAADDDTREHSSAENIKPERADSYSRAVPHGERHGSKTHMTNSRSGHTLSEKGINSGGSQRNEANVYRPQRS